MVSTASELGARRQVIFVSLGGFDTHAGQAAVGPALLGRLAGALQAFHDATVELGVGDAGVGFV